MMSEHLDAILDSFGVSVVAVDRNGIVVQANLATFSLTGFSEEELLGSAADLFVDEKLLNDPRCVEQINRVVVEGFYKHKNGHDVPVSFSTRLVEGPKPGARRIVLCAAALQNPQQAVSPAQAISPAQTGDAEKSPQPQQAERADELRFRDFAQANSDWFWETGLENEFTFISDSFFKKMAVKPEDIIGQPRMKFVSDQERESDPEKWRAHLEVLNKHLPFRDLLYAITDGDGQQRYIKVSGTPFLDEAGQFMGYRGAGEDATDAKMAEEALSRSEGDLRESKQRLTAIMNSVPHAVITIDMESTIQSFNPFAERIFGYSVAEALGQNVSILMPQALHHQHEIYVSGFLETGGLGHTGKRREMTGRRKNGEEFPLEVAVNWMEVSDGVMFVGVCQDITERKEAERERAELEQELLQAHKMESLGTLSGGIAHEINTPMQYVGDNIRFLGDSFADLNSVLASYAELSAAAAKGADVQAELEKVSTTKEAVDLDFLCEEMPTAIEQSMNGVLRVNEIVEAIKQFSHPASKERTLVDIAETIQTTLTVSRNQWKYVSELTTDFDEALPNVPCVPGEFNQVMLNLVVNAAHAVEGKEGGGRITVSAKQCGDWLEIRVSDNGTGIAEENLEKIFEPFYTTKEPGKGTGQGLAISHTIITRSHRGTMTVESVLGEGTTFIIRMPMTDEVELDVAS